ncbi:response regulator [Brevibacterium sp. FAM 24638]|uniref:response regulator n=1 Tax=Brevibacterium sp. FAM 24638 TaxID=3415681 RepID=UPI003C7C248F
MTEETPSAGEAAPSVLVVDDDSWTTRAVTAVLRDTDEFHVLDPVHCGEDAVEAYAAKRPDIVLMDVNMPPGMSGVDATKAIMDIDPDARVLLLTTVSPGPGIARGLEAGALAVVNKTAGDEELTSVVRAALQGDSPGLLRTLAEDIVISGDTIPEAPREAPQLTERELQLLAHLCRGSDYEEIAAAEFLTVHTVKSHARNLRIKLQAKNLAQLVVRSLQFKFYSPE